MVTLEGRVLARNVEGGICGPTNILCFIMAEVTSVCLNHEAFVICALLHADFTFQF